MIQRSIGEDIVELFEQFCQREEIEFLIIDDENLCAGARVAEDVVLDALQRALDAIRAIFLHVGVESVRVFDFRMIEELHVLEFFALDAFKDRSSADVVKDVIVSRVSVRIVVVFGTEWILE